MAILAGGLLVLPDTPTEDVVFPTIPYTEDIGTLTAVWVDPDGTEWPLSNTSDWVGWFTTVGPAGWGANPIEIVADAVYRGGEQVRFIRSKPRRITWPIHVFGRDHMEFTWRNRNIIKAFTRTTQRQTHGWLRVYRGDGSYRQIACYYESGMEGESGQVGNTSANYAVTLYCPDGYWVGDRIVAAERSFVGDPNPTNPNVPANFFSPFMFLGSSRVVSEDNAEVGNTVIPNVGDINTWPEWEITGPMTKVVCENNTLGLRFAVDYTLTAGQTIRITTNRPSVRGPGDANLSGAVDWFNPAGGAYLWPLGDGDNDVRFTVDGAGTGTKIRMLFTPRYESA